VKARVVQSCRAEKPFAVSEQGDKHQRGDPVSEKPVELARLSGTWETA